jgi:signal peptidase I
MFSEVLIALIAVALVQTFLIKPFGVPSQSMENTLQIGDRIIVNRLDSDVTSSDVIVFGHGETWQSKELPPADNLFVKTLRAFGDLTGIGPSSTAYTVKRIIGLPGQKVACCTDVGAVTVDGQPLSEPYVFEDLAFVPGSQDCTTSPRSVRCFPEILVPSENLLVLGDHRSASADSVVGCRGSTQGQECAKFVPLERVVGPVVGRFWPISEFGALPH